MKTKKFARRSFSTAFFNLFILLLLPVLVLTSSSCGKEETPGPCEGIICVRGNCINGQCDCPDGYTGADCNKEKLPLEIIIKNIRVKEFPVTKGTTQWDIGIGKILPDLRVRVHRANSHGAESLILPNAQQGEHNIPLKNGSMTLNFPSQNYFFELWDDDTGDANDNNGNQDGNHDLIASIQMVPYQAGKNFPSKLELKGSGVTLELSIEYKHDQNP